MTHMPTTRTRFVVLCGGRTGSTWVTTSLDSHPQVGCFGELLERGAHRQRVPPRGRQDYLWFNTFMDEEGPGGVRRPQLWNRYLRDLYAPRPDVASIGFKLLYTQAREHAWALPMLAARRVAVIHLIRTNPFDIVLSKLMAEARGGPKHRSVGEDPENPRIAVETEALVKRVRFEERKIRIGRGAVKALAMPVVELRYEDLLEDAGGEFDRVLAWMGLPPMGEALRGSTQRLNEQPYEDTITNFGQVSDVLGRAGYGALLAGRH